MPLMIKPVKAQLITLSVKGLSPLITHSWSEKAIRQMREKHAGKKTKERDIRNPKEEFEAASYRTENGDYGIPAMMIKAAMITAAHKDLGLEKTLLRKAVFLHCADTGNILPLKYRERVMREDTVRIGRGATDLRYRPEYRGWSVEISFTFDADLLQVDDIVNLLNRAGFGCGLGDWRPEKGGEFGRFEVDTTQPVTVDGGKNGD